MDIDSQRALAAQLVAASVKGEPLPPNWMLSDRSIAGHTAESTFRYYRTHSDPFGPVEIVIHHDTETNEILRSQSRFA